MRKFAILLTASFIALTGCASKATTEAQTPTTQTAAHDFKGEVSNAK